MRRCSFSSRSLRSVMSWTVPPKLTTRRSDPAPSKYASPLTHPTDRAVSPPNPKLMVDEGLRIGGIERPLAVRAKSFRIVRIHALHEVLDQYLISGHVEDFLKARIPPANAAVWIVLPPPELGC